MGRLGTLVGRMLRQTCSIAPRQDGAANVDNQPTVAFGTAVANVPCRLADLTDAERAEALASGVYTFTDAILVSQTTAAAPGSQVGTLAERDGTPIEAGPFVVVDVAQRRDVNAPVFKRLLVRRMG